MQYTVILSRKSDGGFYVSAPLLPQWTIEVKTRDEGIAKARKAIADFMNDSEVLSVDVPAPQPNGRFHNIPWEWFGIGKNDPSWDELFDEIEQRREATRETD
jgi:hypothetical protein